MGFKFQDEGVFKFIVFLKRIHEHKGAPRLEIYDEVKVRSVYRALSMTAFTTTENLILFDHQMRLFSKYGLPV